MIRLSMTVPRRPGDAGLLRVEMNVQDDDEAITIAKALAYCTEGDVGLHTDSGLFMQVKYADLRAKPKPQPVQGDKPPWEE